MLKVIALSWLPFVVTVGFMVFNADGRGIYPINGQAVYMLGDSCTINNELDRSLQDMERDFEECLKYHAAYQFTKQYEGYPHFEW